MTRPKPSDRALLPKGMATLLPEAAADRRRLERAAVHVFRSWGYEEVITPLFEYLDVIAPGLGPGVIDKAYTVADRGTGRMMVLRPDMTPQVARMAATLLRDAPRPMRLCYGANVFRYEDEHAGHEREIFQLGAELIGPSHPSADAEIVALAMEVLHQLGLTGAKVAIGHVGLFRAWLSETGTSPERVPLLEEAVVKKDRTSLVELLVQDGQRPSDAARLAGFLDLIGEEDVLDRAAEIVDSPPAREALAALREVIRQVGFYGLSKSVILDLAEIRGREYYSGLIFELFAEGVGYEVGRGGRYDDLIGRFGPPGPSTGFAVHLERVQQALNHVSASAPYGAVDVLLAAPSPDRAVVRLAAELRRRGVRVTVWLEETPPSVAAEHARAMKIPWIVERGTTSAKIVLTETKTLRLRRMSPAGVAAAVLARRKAGQDADRFV
ncbi:MAG: ATP phosphoribosyltransferase regulatory subunit [Nitrospirae bacterium]|nr:ATP phosphoribosyltransferase regulatory subunit [Nitrospirota bacterium]